MSWWILPTTADIGIRAFGNSEINAIKEATMGMQDILISDAGRELVNELTRLTGVWSIERREETDTTMVSWLEEVLYQTEVEERWLVDVQLMMNETELRGQVSYVSAEEIEREVEIKAVTRHDLLLSEVKKGECVNGLPPHIPDFFGPGWMAQIIFDI